MTYCIIGMKRTRSSVLSLSISNYHDSDNYFGQYDGITPSFKTKIYFSKLPLDQQKSAKLKFFQEEVKKMTLEVLSKPNNVVKLFPRYMIYHEIPSVKDHAKSVLPKNYNDLIIITDIEEYFQLSKFQKIYFLQRDVTDSICSYGYGIYLKKFQFVDEPELNYFTKISRPISIDLNSGWLDFCIFEYMLLNHLRSYLDDKKLSYHLLDYDDIPKYCSDRYSGTEIGNYKYSGFNYKNLITNYEEVRKYIFNFIHLNNNYIKENIIFK